jgi:signal transduction histidine kinase/CheY-like chemotaxis protein
MKRLWDRTLSISILVGIILFFAVFGWCTKKEKSDGSNLINETIDFMKTQCERYDNQIVTSQTKTEIALLDKLHELSLRLSEVKSQSYEAVISDYVDNQRMSGVAILDENGEYVTGVFLDGKTYKDCENIILDNNVLQIIDYPQKNYLSHIEKDDGSVYDYVAVSLQGKRGLVFGYIKEGENEIADRESGIINMLTGYQLEMGGIMVVARNGRVLTTNAEVYPPIEECESLLSVGGGVNSPVTVDFNGKKYLAGGAKSETYELYTFFPESEIYRQRSVSLVYVFVIYILFVMLFMFGRQREMQRTEEQRMKFLRQMSHDIRTPINGIRGMIRIANSAPEDLEKQETCRQKIWEASDLLIDLVNDVLDMGRLNSGEVKLEEKPFNMRELVESAVAVAEGAAQHRGIKINVEKLEGRHWQLIGSPTQVSRVLNNIIGNAIKYNKDKGLINISCRELAQGEQAGRTAFEFVCSDTGIGMDKEFQKQMYEQFTQENAVDELAHHGTGLGLSIVKSLVEQMQGTIECESKRDEGTTFIITLPFQIDPKAVFESPKGSVIEEMPEASLKGVSVLLVEDNQMNMEIAEFILEDMGIKTTEAWNGKEAVEIFSNSEPGTFDIILMDMMMPVMNGEEATRTIRKLERPDAKTIPIIAATANAFAEDIQAALSAGMNDHLAKPIDEKPLRQMIAKYVLPVGA